MPSANRPSGPTHPTAVARERADAREQLEEALNPQADDEEPVVKPQEEQASRPAPRRQHPAPDRGR